MLSRLAPTLKNNTCKSSGQTLRTALSLTIQVASSSTQTGDGSTTLAATPIAILETHGTNHTALITKLAPRNAPSMELTITPGREPTVFKLAEML